jgi:hypothetical protein
MTVIRIIAFAGPSGSGKSELVRRLGEEFQEQVTFWQQVTTRGRRGPDDAYIFASKEEFESIRAVLTCITTFGENCYGTFPDPGAAEGRLVLTIVDRMGLECLLADAHRQNSSGSGKFGEGATVEVVPVLMRYDLAAEAVAARAGGRNRSPEFVRAELDRLLAMPDGTWAITIDNSNSWTNTAEFFEEHLLPMISAPDRVAERLAEVAELGARLFAGLMGLQPSPALLEAAAAALDAAADRLAAWTHEPDAAIDDVDAVLLGCGENLGPSVCPTEVHSGEIAAEEVDSAQTDPAPVEVIPEALPSEQPLESAPSEPTQSEPTAPQAFASFDFESWLLENGVADRAFRDAGTLRSAFAQYLTDCGASAAEISDVSSQSAPDQKGGKTVGFSVAGTGWTYRIEYSERLRRMLKHGPA